MLSVRMMVIACLVLSAGAACAYPQNYLSAKLGASVATSAKLEAGNSVDTVMSDGPVSKGGFAFAAVDQARVFTVDLGQERVFDRVQIGNGGPRASRLKIEVSSKGADGPYDSVSQGNEMAYWQVLRLPQCKARWIRFDLGTGSEGINVHLVRIYKGYEHPKLAEVTKLLCEHIKPGLPGLERFYASAAAKDWPNACKHLRAYFAATMPPEGGPDPKYDLSRAKAVEAGEHDYAGIKNTQKVPIDWSYSKNSDWYQHKNFLNRGSATGVPMDAYFHTGDPHWAEFFKSIMYDWIDANPVPEVMSRQDYPSWRTLDTGCRSAWLISRFPKATVGKDIDDELWANYLYTIWQHADFLAKDDFDGGNWLATVSNSVMSIALQFPMFKEQKSWLTFGAISFETNVMRDIHPDGKEVEDAPGYVCMAYAGMFGTLRSLEKAGVVVNPEARERMNRALDFISAIAQPNLNQPYFGDGGGGPTPYNMDGAAKYFKRDDVLYRLSAGKQGKMPTVASFNFPDGGWSIMRSSFTEKPFENARHLVFKSSAGSHGHPDVLSITNYAYGRELLMDPGITSYEAVDEERYQRTSYHNTICIDGRQMFRSYGKTEKWVSNDGLDYVFGTHLGYKDLTQRRGVLFVKPEYWIVHDDIIGEGSQSHTYDQNWHFFEGAGLTEDPATKAVRTTFATKGNMLMLPVDPTSLKSESTDFLRAGTHMDNGGARDIACKGWCYSQSGTAPKVFDTVLYPYPGSKAPEASVRRLAVDGKSQTEATALEVKIDGKTDYVVVSYTGSCTLTVPEIGLVVDGESAVVRAAKGKPVRVSGANLKSVSLGGKTLLSQDKPGDIDKKL